MIRKVPPMETKDPLEADRGCAPKTSVQTIGSPLAVMQRRTAGSITSGFVVCAMNETTGEAGGEIHLGKAYNFLLRQPKSQCREGSWSNPCFLAAQPAFRFLAQPESRRDFCWTLRQVCC